MNKPFIDEMIGGFDSKYTLIITVAKRARQLTHYSAGELHSKSQNPVSVAMREIADGKVSWSRA